MTYKRTHGGKTTLLTIWYSNPFNSERWLRCSTKKLVSYASSTLFMASQVYQDVIYSMASWCWQLTSDRSDIYLLGRRGIAFWVTTTQRPLWWVLAAHSPTLIQESRNSARQRCWEIGTTSVLSKFMKLHIFSNRHNEEFLKAGIL